MSKKTQRAATRRKKEQQKKRQNLIMSVVALVVVVGVVALVIGSGGGISPAPAVAQDRLDLDPVLGDPDAPVTIIKYASYGCDACRAWHNAGVVDDILVEFAGQVRFVQRDLPIIYPSYDQMTAEMAQCALDQGNEQFWLFYDALYSRSDTGDSQDDVLRLAGQAGLDAGALESCYEADTHRATVQYDRERGAALGLRSTPTFIVDGQRLFNPRPEDLQEAVRQAVANAG